MSQRHGKPAQSDEEEIDRKSVVGNRIFETGAIKPEYSICGGAALLCLGDSIQLLKHCRTEVFELIFADPPYFLSNDGITCHSGKMVSVNKGKWDKGPSFAVVHDFNVAWLAECRRVLKPNGTIFVSGTAHNIYSIGFAMQSLGFKILNDIVWYKVNPPNLSCRYFVHATETILWAKRDAAAKHVFNYQEMKAIGDPSKGKQMQSLWHISPPTRNERRYGKHPTQKPEVLLDRIIRAASNPGDLVLDPFSGSGTTGVVAIRLGRSYIGFESDPNYIDLSLKRITHEVENQQ